MESLKILKWEKTMKAKFISKVYDEMESGLQKHIGMVEEKNEKNKDLTIEEKEKSETYEAGTDCFEIIHDQLKGRHAIATRNISPGQVILIEKPVTYALLPGK
jgi:phage regulator Rha-like protein